METLKVFLGGTCAGKDYRPALISKLNIEYLNPVVDDWNEEAYQEELRQRESCDYCLYYITPHMADVYSIAEVIDDVNKRPEKTIFYFEEFPDNPKMNKSLNALSRIVLSNGGLFFTEYEELIKFLNG